MSYIGISKNKQVIVDDNDYDYLTQWRWSYNNGYACRMSSSKGGSKRVKIYMHRLITNCPDNLEVDHINRNRLDNRRSNLRVCNRATNMQNKSKTERHNHLRQKYLSFESGITLSTKGYWQVKIQVNGKQKQIGNFRDIANARRRLVEYVSTHY